ncbi:uncharacterized protein LOC106865635 [Brachypodium distachyon]|uniref:uncharacterized protein LOC106865635 n=1 Tax=Brachypodium distachyon TaxID=15368 RepID=UPI000D0DB2B9|nr:uncharacterized protein LOC106865635 [Brachypodium distachyon]|eukprot:XP_014751623.2 uncharacterized protein LOC106865635 [Brachypodium distachyon]
MTSAIASRDWVAERSKAILKKDTPNIGCMELQEKLQTEYNVTTRYHAVWKGRERAMNEIYGTWASSFRHLFSFKAEMEKRSPGSIVEVDTHIKDGKVYFHRFFMALKPCVDGFLDGCRPYLSIDSTALNGKWNGHLAACTALDGLNWMYPVAFGFIEVENEDNWRWFMRQVYKAIGPIPKLVVSTDACKGLENAVKKVFPQAVFPQAEQRECFRHLMQNFSKKYHGDMIGRMWAPARTYRPEMFEYHFCKVLEANPTVGTYLSVYHNLKWMRSSFDTEIKCDYIHNNLAECFNNWIRGIKDLPVDELADTLRGKIMKLFDTRRKIGNKLRGWMLPAVVQQVNNRTRGLGHLKVTRSSNWKCEVRNIEKDNLRHVVDIEQNECTCLEWQHTGKPCEHALVFLIGRRNVQMEKYLHEYFSVKRFKAAYMGGIELLTDRSQWPNVKLDFVLHAPLPKRSAGRSRKLRLKSCLEKGGSSSKKNPPKGQLGSQNRCKKCDQLGHREAGCPTNGVKKRVRKSRKKSVNTEVDVECRFEGDAQTSPPGDITSMAALQRSPGPMTRSQVARGTSVRGTTSLAILQSSPGPVTRSQVALGTPVRGTSPLAVLQNSPGPITRRQLALAMASERTLGSPISPSRPLVTAAKKITPKRKKRA